MTTLARRDFDHVNLWKSELIIAREDFNAAVDAEKAKRQAAEADAQNSRELLSDLRGAVKADVLSRPVTSVSAWFESELIGEAQNQRDAAYRTKDHAMRHMWRLDELHHADEDDEDTCSCGRLIQQCPESSALAGVRQALYRWEAGQTDRMN